MSELTFNHCCRFSLVSDLYEVLLPGELNVFAVATRLRTFETYTNETCQAVCNYLVKPKIPNNLINL